MGSRGHTHASNVLPRHGYALVTISARDENGFLHLYGEIETTVSAFEVALKAIRAEGAPREPSSSDIIELLALAAGEGPTGRSSARPSLPASDLEVPQTG